jgi:hypothetical protein
VLTTSKKLKQGSTEVFNASKEIEAMKHLTLHHFWRPALPLPHFNIKGFDV